MNQPATVTMYFDKRGCAPGFYSLKWYLYHNGKQRLVSTGMLLAENDVKFLKQYSGGLRGTVKDEEKRKLWHLVYDEVRGQALEVIRNLGKYFTFEAFREGLQAPSELAKKEKHDVFTFSLKKEKQLAEDEQFGSSDNYKAMRMSLSRFVQALPAAQRHKYGLYTGGELPFEAVTPEFLKAYEKWMLQYGKLGKARKLEGEWEEPKESPASLTTIGMYCRALRSIYNQAIAEGSAPAGAYPFGKNGFVIPNGNNTKKALSINDIEKLLTCPLPEGSAAQRSRDLWVFSYLSNGANFADLLRLKRKMIIDDQIRLVRRKTAGTTRRNRAEIVIRLFPQSREILARWAAAGRADDEILWSFMPAVADSLPLEKKVADIIKTTNFYMKQIAASLGITGDVRTYAARHSFATILLRSEAPLAFISQSLGHKSIGTTQAYLGSFEDEQTQKYLSALLPGSRMDNED